MTRKKSDFTETLRIRYTKSQERALMELAAEQETSASEVVRRLIRRAHDTMIRNNTFGKEGK